MKRFVLLTPFLLTFASVLQLAYISSIVVPPEQLLRPLLALWLLLALLILPAYWLTRDWTAAALLLSVLVLGLCYSTDFFSLVLISTIVIGAGLLIFVRRRREWPSLLQLTGILATVGVFFSLYALYALGTLMARIPWVAYEQEVQQARQPIGTLSPPASRPDVYYIILDGYSRADILQELFHFDNSEFLTFLRNRGFIVPASVQSNYPATPLSVASTLNMDYIQALLPALGRNHERWLVDPLIDHSRVRSMFEVAGYQTVSLSTNWSITDNPTTDVYLHPFPVMLTDLEGFMLFKTPLQYSEPALQAFASIPTAATHRKIVRYSFTALADLPQMPGPKFVFAHIISPHPPFVFDSAGRPREISYPFSFKSDREFPGSLKEYPHQYVEQVQFVNHSLENTISAILAKSTTPPIIILQADHGSGLLTDFNSVQRTCIHERFSPFAAYYLPHLDPQAIPADISAVNIFRIVFNQYFDANLPLLDSRQYFYADSLSYYEFEDVTARVNEACLLTSQ